MGFTGDIHKFSKDSLADADRIRRGVILKLFTAVIMDTPVQAGLLRGNWQTTIGKPAQGKLVKNSKTGVEPINKVGRNLGKFGDTVFMTNNLPYAKVAEYGEWHGPTAKVTSQGFSRKAPAGMVRKNAIRFDKLIKRLIKK